MASSLIIANPYPPFESNFFIFLKERAEKDNFNRNYGRNKVAFPIIRGRHCCEILKIWKPELKSSQYGPYMLGNTRAARLETIGYANSCSNKSAITSVIPTVI